MSSTVPPAVPPPPIKPPTAASLPTKIYNSLIGSVDKHVPQKLRPLWSHPAGPKTVFFWAPAFKWGLVIAGLKDLTRPAETLSIQQSSALAATGLVWSRYSLVIIPKNYGLFSVNLFVALTQCVQVGRAIMYQMEQKSAVEASQVTSTEVAVKEKQK